MRQPVIVGAAMSLLVGLLAASCAAGAASGPSTQPVQEIWLAVPADGVIAEPGSYCLNQDLLTDRTIGIEIRADRVRLDLRGHALRFTGTPKAGDVGIAIRGRSDVVIANGRVGGFWYGIQFTEGRGLRVRDLHFDNIPYLAINVARSQDVAISDNTFSGFRYDIEKPKGSTYLVGINLSADDVIITNNRFSAEPPKGTGRGIQMETVCVLFRPSRNGVVAHNDLSASESLHRSYGVWVAGKADAAILNNRIHNMHHGVTVAADGSAVVAGNRFVVDPPAEGAPLETTGISAPSSKDLLEKDNTFDGVTSPLTVAGAPTTRGG